MSRFHSFRLVFLVDKNQMEEAAEKLEQEKMIKWTLWTRSYIFFIFSCTDIRCIIPNL